MERRSVGCEEAQVSLWAFMKTSRISSPSSSEWARGRPRYL